jgi:hypothetical protein
MGRIREA